jgi:hypothetical protein
MTFSFINVFDTLINISDKANYYSSILGFSFVASNYLYNKLNNKIGITIERMFDLQYIFIFYSIAKVSLYLI